MKISKLLLAVLALVLCGFGLIGFAHAGLNDGLVAYYPFNGNANDESGNGNHGTVHSVLQTEDRFGNLNSAYQFDGVNSYISVPSSTTLNPVDQLTISLWVKMSDIAVANGWIPLIHKGGLMSSWPCLENREYNVWFRTYPSQYFMMASAGDESCQKVLYCPVSTSDEWIYFAAVSDRVDHTMKIYINGALAAEMEDAYSSYNNNSYEIRFGWTEEVWTETFYHFKGILDDIRIYNRALSSDEVAALYGNSGPQSDLTVTIDPQAAGTVTGEGISCGSGNTDCTETYSHNAQVSLTAAANNGYEFEYWDDGVSQVTDNPLVLSMDTDKQFTVKFKASGVNTGLVAYYPFNGNANDESGNGNHGTVYGATLTEDRLGDSNSAYAFDGYDDYVEVPNSFRNLDIIGQFTLAAWVNPASLSYDQRSRPIIWKNSQCNINQDNYFLAYGYSVDSSPKFVVGLEETSSNMDGRNFHIASQIHDSGVWYHVVGVYDGTNLALFVNGVLEGINNIGTINPYTGLCPLRIGNNLNSNHDNKGVFDGAIDEVRIYNRALSHDEILELYNADSPVEPQLTVMVDPQAGGTVTGEGINCGNGNADCQESYAEDTQVVLTAVASEGYEFEYWSGSVNQVANNPLVLSMDASKEIAAKFKVHSNLPPVIDSFVADPSSGGAPLAVTFTCIAHDPDGTIASYTINYGDGTAAETNSTGVFSHSYANPASYTASLNVADNKGSPAATPKSASIQIQGWSGLSISGKVITETFPLSGVTVKLTGAATGTTQTDDAGLFGFSNLTTGVYTLTPSKDHYAFSPAKRSANLTSQSITRIDFTASLMPGAVHGVVHANSSDGPLLGGVLVTCGEKKAKTKSDGSYVIPKLPAGEQTLSFSKPGYQPTLEQVTILPGQDVDAGNDTFLIANGVIKVIITPKKARLEGAQWQLDDGNWYPSGTMLPCAAGQHTITFKEIAGWGAPSPQIVAISPGNITSVQGTYIQGAIQVIITPAAAIKAGAQWQLDRGDWHASREFVNIPPGNHTVTFEEIPGWVTPEPQTITISPGSLTTSAGEYIPIVSTTINSSISGTISRQAGKTAFSFTVPTSGTLIAYTKGVDTFGYLKDSTFLDMSHDDNASEPNFSIIQHNLTPGTYYIVVTPTENPASGNYELFVKLSPNLPWSWDNIPTRVRCLERNSENKCIQWVYDSTYARIRNLQEGTDIIPDTKDELFQRANKSGSGVLSNNDVVISNSLYSDWSDRLRYDSRFNTIWDPISTKGAFEVISITDEQFPLFITENKNAYYFSYNPEGLSLVSWVDYIRRIFKAYQKPIETLTIVAHGNDGTLFLSNGVDGVITTNDLKYNDRVREAFTKLRHYLEPGGNSHILLFSCYVGADKNFVKELAKLTKSWVHANSHLTGSTPETVGFYRCGSRNKKCMDWQLDVVCSPKGECHNE